MRISTLCVLTIGVVFMGRPVDADEGFSAVVNPRTGEVTLRNDTDQAVELDGYLFVSTEEDGDDPFTGNLADWDDLTGTPTPGWFVGQANAKVLSEVNLLGSMTVPANGAIALGTPYKVQTPAQIGDPEPEFDFTYSLAGQGAFQGDLEFVNDNNVVLVVDRGDGSASLVNQSEFDVQIDNYNIISPTDRAVLTPGSWDRLRDNPLYASASWQSFDATSISLAEGAIGSTLIPKNGGSISLGTPIDPLLLDDETDLSFRFSVADADPELDPDGFGLLGGVLLIGDAPVTALQGDFNGDLVVDAADYALWRNNLGEDESVLGGAGDGMNGVDQGDYDLWRLNYGKMLPGSGQTANAASAPEPMAVVALGMAAAVVTLRRRRR